MSRVRSALTVGALLVGTVGLPAVGASSAAAAGGTLYVNNAAGAHCTDSGSGAQSAPFCHVAAAAAVVQPGQTVEIAAGSYVDTAVTVTRSGTADAPITFRSQAQQYSSGGVASLSGGAPNYPDSAIVVKGADHLRFENLTVLSNQRPAVVVDGGHDVSFTNIAASGGGVRITDASDKVTWARGDFSYAPGPLLQVDGGSTGTVLTTNVVQANYVPDMTGILVKDAPNTVVVANTVTSSCFAGIVLDGGSTGAVVENNVVNTAKNQNAACATPAAATGITVGANATAGTKVDYNLIDPRSGGAPYSWAGAAFGTQDQLTANTGQGVHDFVALTYVPKGPDAPVDHRIDSADETAPGMLPTDRGGQAPVDDPTVANTGTGSGFRDRGAYEMLDIGSAFTPAGPTRLLDTRQPIGVPAAQAVAADGTVDLQVAGVAGVPVEGVTAVTMNVTVTDPQVDGWLTVYPHGAAVPNTSNLNWPAGRTVSNLVTVPVVDGKVSFHNASGGTVHLVADLAGYYGPKGSLFHAQGPARLLDTRQPIGVPAAQAVAADGTVDLQVAGVAGVPVEGVTAVTMNVTVTDPQVDGWLTVYPHGAAVPNTSNLNWPAGRTVSNLVTVPVVDGKVSFHNASGGTVHLVADLAGYYGPKGSLFHAQGPARLLDTRQPIGVPAAQAVAADGTVDLQVAGVAGVPVEGVTAVTMNVTVTDPQVDGWLTVYPHGAAVPNTSNLNWPAGRTVSNLVTVPVVDGKVSFHNASGGTVHLVADLAGYYGPKGSLFHAQGPARLLDTRQPIGVPAAQAVAADGTVDLQVAGVAGVPVEGVTAVTMNVTVTDPQVDGWLTVYPHGAAVPNTSNLNWPAGHTVSNLVTVPVVDGKVSFHNASGGTVHLVADLAGYYATEGKVSYRPAGPIRVLDTRQDTYWESGVRPAATVPAWGTVDVPVGEIPNAAAVTLNVTVTEPGTDGHLTVFPHGDAAPNASNLNFLPGETIPNQVVVPVKDGKVSFYNASGAPLHLIVDLFGYQSY